MSANLPPAIPMPARKYDYPFSINPGLWIRAYLYEFRRGSPYRMWKEYISYAMNINPRRRKYCNYNTFRRYIKFLKDYGLIVLIESETVERRPKNPGKKIFRYKINYYNIVIERADDERWSNLQGREKWQR